MRSRRVMQRIRMDERMAESAAKIRQDGAMLRVIASVLRNSRDLDEAANRLDRIGDSMEEIGRDL